MSGISDNCPIVFINSKNMGLAVGIVSIGLSQIWAKLQVFPFFVVFQPPSWIFHISMSRIIAGCIIEFPTPENKGVTVGISSLSSTVAAIWKFFTQGSRYHPLPGLFGMTPNNSRIGYGIAMLYGAKCVKMNHLQLYGSDKSASTI